MNNKLIAKNWLTIFVSLIITTVGSIETVYGKTVDVAVFEDHASVINQYIQSDNCPTLENTELSDNQMLAEYLIFCNALVVANFQHKIRLVPYPVAQRVLQAIKKEEVIASSFGLWRSQIEKYQIQPATFLLEKNQFSKGFYTSKQRKQSLPKASFQQLKDLVVVANKNWLQDWEALECTKSIHLHVNQYQQMFNMLELGRADLVPLTFSAREDLRREAFGITLYPVDGIKITFNDSLHFGVNTQSAIGKKLYQALESGLKTLHSKGVIQSTYERLGITNPKVESWRDLGCQQKSQQPNYLFF